jgi:hypothetical protein
MRLNPQRGQARQIRVLPIAQGGVSPIFLGVRVGKGKASRALECEIFGIGRSVEWTGE